MAEADAFVFLPLGGVGEIGMNLAAYGYGPPRERRWLVVDMGVSFSTEDLPGIDGILPDIKFLTDRKDRIDGIVITHAHEDHFGALQDLWPRLQAPVYMTPFAAGLLAAKLAEEPGAPKIPVQTVQQGERLMVGRFDVEFVRVAHSIPEPNAVAIRTPYGVVLHTGDWKLDPAPGAGAPTDEDRLAELGREGVRALVCDSTNAVRDGISPSEGEVAHSLERLIMEAPQRVIVTTFSSNVARIRAVAEAAQRAGRDVVVVGRAIRRAVEVARELGYLDGLPEFHDQDAYGYLPRNKVLALMTGSQGEPRAALARIATKDHRAVALAQGDRVIFSSRTIPGNEKAVNNIINALIDLGAEVITDRLALVHTSGHPRRDELRQLYDLTKPDIVIPVHGEALHLHEHARFARSITAARVLEVRNGDVTKLGPGDPERLERIASGRLYRDGRLVVGSEAAGVGDRKRLAFAGVVSVAVVLSESGVVLEDPTAALVGIPAADRDGEPMLEIALDAADEALDSLPQPRRRDAGLVREAVRRAVRSAISAAWGKKPATIVHVTHVAD
ncbi:ribonuclease J [Propylenella binzhouense]|uniref:Ribonuclease J n=1 Tax=Propylenella binzhouense TaxID=2555902 RepID=A0A964T4L1_9HYPH|nr:ribonuclease J [Propylenella binzhouense]MYZ47822.1 ribonuclease J [Propylenella binzhouense]